LVVDDEPALLSLLVRFLERASYPVRSAPSGEAALPLFQGEPEIFGLVITDMTMDGMGGEELIQKVRAVRADIPAILMSGYPYVPQMPKVSFLQKPFLPAMLIEAVQKALKA
jgi:DNA-binding NtrC family response regulator